MFLTAIIIDDEQKGIDAIKILASRYLSHLKIIGESDLAQKSIEMIECYKPDIVFLDINMPEMNGFELLEKLEWRNFDLIFTTAHQEYALKALKSNAVDYLLKPIDHEELCEAISKIKTKREDNKKPINFSDYKKFLTDLAIEIKNKIVIPSFEGIESIDVNEIIKLESKSNYTQVYLNNSVSFLATKSLKEFETLLCSQNKNFMRVHHSFIINLTKVTRYFKGDDNIVMVDQRAVPLSKRKKETFFRWLNT